jgi:hypothetical protein
MRDRHTVETGHLWAVLIFLMVVCLPLSLAFAIWAPTFPAATSAYGTEAGQAEPKGSSTNGGE